MCTLSRQEEERGKTWGKGGEGSRKDFIDIYIYIYIKKYESRNADPRKTQSTTRRDDGGIFSLGQRKRKERKRRTGKCGVMYCEGTKKDG